MTSYGCNFARIDDEEWFRDWLKPLPERKRLLIVHEFLQSYTAIEVEYFTLLCMSEGFVATYEEKRSYTVKEAFRRACRKLLADTIHTVPLLDTVVQHIKAAGSFKLDDLAGILGRMPLPHETEQVRTFLGALSNDDLKTLLSQPH